MSAERKILVQRSLLLVAGVLVAVLASDAGQWDDPALVALLLAVALFLDRLTVALGALRVTMVDVGLLLAAAILGPAPAALIAGIAMVVDAVRSKLPRHVALVNISQYVLLTALVGAAIDTLAERGTIEPGTGDYVLAVALMAVAWRALGLVLLFQARSIAGFAWREDLRSTVAPVAPWDLASFGLIALTVHFHETVGVVAVPVVVAILLFFHRLLVNIAAAEQRSAEIERLAAERDRFLLEALAAEDRERTRLAAELHDDALQTLLAAKQDLVEGLTGDEDSLTAASDSIAVTINKLRDLMVRLHPAASADALGAVLRELGDRLARRAGCAVDVRVGDEVEGHVDPVLGSVARELLVNIAKHARATRVEILLQQRGEDLVLRIADDGIGFDAAERERKRADGHIGLSLVEERVVAHGGRLTLTSSPGSGTTATVLVRAGEPAVIRPEEAGSPA